MPKTKKKTLPRGNVRIPKPIIDEVDQIVQNSKLYLNRQQFIETAIRESIEKTRPFKEREAGIAAKSREQEDDFLSVVKDAFLAHAIINTVKGESLPSHHLDPKQIKQRIRQFIEKKAKGKDRKNRLDRLTEELLNYHIELLEKLNLLNNL